MSVLYSSDWGWILSHLQDSEIQLQNDSNNSMETVILNSDLFEIQCPFRETLKVKKNKKYKNVSDLKLTPASNYLTLSETTEKIKKLSGLIINEGIRQGIFSPVPPQLFDSKNDNNAVARKTAVDFFSAVKDFNNGFPKFSKVNDGTVGVRFILFDDTGNFHNFILPPDTVVHCEDVKELPSFLDGDQKFSLVVMDPPWWNKYIRRRKRKQSEAGYPMMESCDIGKLPIRDITEDQALVAVWCTNSRAHQAQLVDEFFPSWGVEYLTTWYWLKVTKEGTPVCPFNQETRKQPYESVILGRRIYQKTDLTELPDTLPPTTKVIVSVPSSINSHKPPLFELLRPYVRSLRSEELNSTNCCELFARSALPGFTSVGNEVLKLMHESLYVPLMNAVESNELCACR